MCRSKLWEHSGEWSQLLLSIAKFAELKSCVELFILGLHIYIKENPTMIQHIANSSRIPNKISRVAGAVDLWHINESWGWIQQIVV